jgi:hypothetical protein
MVMMRKIPNNKFLGIANVSYGLKVKILSTVGQSAFLMVSGLFGDKPKGRDAVG